jgi:hypothetical protein
MGDEEKKENEGGTQVVNFQNSAVATQHDKEGTAQVNTPVSPRDLARQIRTFEEFAKTAQASGTVEGTRLWSSWRVVKDKGHEKEWASLLNLLVYAAQASEVGPVKHPENKLWPNEFFEVFDAFQAYTPDAHEGGSAKTTSVAAAASTGSRASQRAPQLSNEQKKESVVDDKHKNLAPLTAASEADRDTLNGYSAKANKHESALKDIPDVEGNIAYYYAVAAKFTGVFQHGSDELGINTEDMVQRAQRIIRRNPASAGILCGLLDSLGEMQVGVIAHPGRLPFLKDSVRGLYFAAEVDLAALAGQFRPDKGTERIEQFYASLLLEHPEHIPVMNPASLRMPTATASHVPSVQQSVTPVSGPAPTATGPGDKTSNDDLKNLLVKQAKTTTAQVEKLGTELKAEVSGVKVELKSEMTVLEASLKKLEAGHVKHASELKKLNNRAQSAGANRPAAVDGQL